MMGASFIALRWVPPAHLGAWQFALLLEQLLHFLRLGVPNAVNRQVPMLLGEGREQESTRIFQLGMTYMLLCGSLLSTVVLFALLFFPDFAHVQRNALIGLAVCAPLNMLVNLLEGMLRGTETIRKLAVCYLVLTPIGVISVELPANYGFEGYLARLCLLAAMQMGVMASVMPLPLRLRWDVAGWFRLIKTGFPLYVWNYLSTLSASMLPWYVGIVGGVAMLGQLGPANSLLALIALVPASFSSYLGPAQNFAFGRGHEPRILVQRLKKSFVITLGVTLVISLCGASIFGPVIRHWLPDYAPITEAVLIIAAIGCARCYVILQTSIGLFLDWWLIRNSLVVSVLARALSIAAIWWLQADTFIEILSIWLVGEINFLLFQWWQLTAYLHRLESLPSNQTNAGHTDLACL